MRKALVVIPTYNEAENIEAMIRKVVNLADFDLLIVDDASPDGTSEIAQKVAEEFPERVKIENRKGKLGLGTAYIHGFKKALAWGYDFICEMDCDFSHNPDDLPRLLAACENDMADLAVGSRYIQGVNVVNWPMSRVLLSYCAGYYVRFITGMPVMDTTAGFKCYRRKVLESINLDEIRFIGYAFQIEMKYKTWKKGFQIKEVPIIFTDRTKGQSKMSKNIIREAVWGVIQLRFMV
jgi:dolichol-phosphate mannosyltransferase